MNWKNRYKKIKSSAELKVGKKYLLKSYVELKKPNYIMTILKEVEDGFSIHFKEINKTYNTTLKYTHSSLNKYLETGAWKITKL